MPSSFASRAVRFYESLEPPRVPRDVNVMNPYADVRARKLVRDFLRQFFPDDDERLFVFGINPGRFGAGVTGVTFTAPVALADFCGVPNHLPRRRELSSIFVYDFIERFGGTRSFYRSCFLTAVSPLGFTHSGKNLNYYDRADLAAAVSPFIVQTMTRQLALGARRDHAIVLGKGANRRVLEALNREHGWFGDIHALEHPRWIMQYRRRRLDAYADEYVRLFARLVRA